MSLSGCFNFGARSELRSEENHMPFSLNDIHTVGEVLAFAARTEIMPRFGKLAPAQVRRKSSTFDLVTEADEAAEVAITAALKSAFPDGVVIGEESTHRKTRASPNHR
jgi:fructose-1,6-bisphosphatase/inositol monophosphatase family enzyme